MSRANCESHGTMPAKHLVYHRIYYIHDVLAQLVGSLHGACLGINTDDGFGIGLEKEYPLVGEVNLHTVDIVNLLVLVKFLNLL